MRGNMASMTAFILSATATIFLVYSFLYYIGLARNLMLGLLFLILSITTINSTIFLVDYGLVSMDEIVVGSLISIAIFLLFALKIAHLPPITLALFGIR